MNNEILHKYDKIIELCDEITDIDFNKPFKRQLKTTVRKIQKIAHETKAYTRNFEGSEEFYPDVLWAKYYEGFEEIYIKQDNGHYRHMYKKRKSGWTKTSLIASEHELDSDAINLLVKRLHDKFITMTYEEFEEEFTIENI
jgi:hypothetical protein